MKNRSKNMEKKKMPTQPAPEAILDQRSRHQLSEAQLAEVHGGYAARSTYSGRGVQEDTAETIRLYL